MKRSLYPVLLAGLVLAGCAKEAAVDIESASKVITVTANAEAPVTTKATATDAGVIAWSASDQIAVFDDNDDTVYPLTYVSGTNKSFSGTVSSSPVLKGAVAPYGDAGESIDVDGAVLWTVKLPASYSNYVPGTTNAPMVASAPTAEGDNYVFEFKHIAALAKVTYVNVPVGAKTLYFEADANISGSQDLDISEENVKFTTPSTSASTSVKLDMATAVTVANQTMAFYIPVPVGTYTEFKVKLMDSDNNTVSGTAKKLSIPSAEQSFTRAELYILPSITLDEVAITKGDAYTWTLASGDLGTTGSPSSSVTKGDDSANQLTWSAAYTWGSDDANKYFSWDSSNGRGVQIGSGSSANKCSSLVLSTSAYSGYVENVIVNFSNASSGGAALSVKVGNTSLTYGEENATSATSTTTATSYIFTTDAQPTGTIELTFTNNYNKAFYIKSIEINGDSRAEQTLSFSSSIASVELNGDFTEPTLSGAQTTVAYSSSNTDVATVDASTGEVTLVGAGTTIITATAEATSDYQEGTASYTLTVLEGKSTIAEVIEGGAGTYDIDNLLVYSVKGSNVILGDDTGKMLLFKSSHGLNVGDNISISGATVEVFSSTGVLEITGGTFTTNSTDNTVDHGTALDLSVSENVSSLPTSAYFSAQYVTLKGAQSGRNITDATTNVKVYLNAADATCDGSNVVASGYVYSYSSSYSNYYFQAVSIEPDPDTPTLSVSPTSLNWEATSYGSDNSKDVAVTLNGNATGYSVSYTDDDSAWTVSDNGAGTITVYPNAENTSTTDAKTLTLTIAHKDDTSLTETVTCTQVASGASATPTWTRVTAVSTLTAGGTFIIGYEATANSGVIVPMRAEGTATTSKAGYISSGTTSGSSVSGTIDMSTITETTAYEVTIAASTSVTGAITIKIGDNYLGNTNTKNNCKLFTSEATTTAFTPTVGSNDVFTLVIAANATYTTLQYNSGSPRFAVYSGAQKNVVIYKKSE